MKRLTEKLNGGLYNTYCTKKPLENLANLGEVVQKLGQLEDLEEMLGIDLEKLQETVEKAKKYDEKETSIKVKVIDEPDLHYIYYCPSCGATLMVDRDKHPKHLFNYCGKCRQKLDWN